jgi:hypothetical protein
MTGDGRQLPLPVYHDGAVDLVSRPAQERDAELRVQRCRHMLLNCPGQHRKASAPGEQPGGPGCLLVVRVAGDPALVEDQQQTRLRPPRRLPDVSAEQRRGLLGQAPSG